MPGISTTRLSLLRAMYAFIAVGLAVTRWPDVVNRPAGTPHMDTVVASMLGAVSLLAIAGILHPVRMLPLLFFELLWKSTWVLLWGIPLWAGNDLDSARQETLIACLIGILPIALVMPWGYVFDRSLKSPRDQWHWESPGRDPSTSPEAPGPHS